jgi:hypothetical protein
MMRRKIGSAWGPTSWARPRLTQAPCAIVRRLRVCYPDLDLRHVNDLNLLMTDLFNNLFGDLSRAVADPYDA